MKNKLVINGGILLASVFLSNFLNFLFNAILGRWLSFENFGLITLVVTLYYLSSICTNALAATLNFSTSKLLNEKKDSQTIPFLHMTIRWSLGIALIASVGLLLSIPLLMSFFHVNSPIPFIAFMPILVGSVFVYALIGYFQGKLEFARAGLIMLSEPLAKLFIGILLALLGFGMFAYFSIPLSVTIAALVGWWFAHMIRTASGKKSTITYRFPKQFFATTVGMGIGSTIFFSVDILLVKHFFTPTLAGQYALVSLIGKMMYFLAVLPNIFTLPLAVRAKDQRQANQIFWGVFLATALLAIPAV